MVKVLLKKLNPKVKIPEYKSQGASGMDLLAFIDKSIIKKYFSIFFFDYIFIIVHWS